MQFYVDEEGNKYRVDRETGERILVQPAEPEKGGVSDPEITGDQED